MHKTTITKHSNTKMSLAGLYTQGLLLGLSPTLFFKSQFIGNCINMARETY